MFSPDVLRVFLCAYSSRTKKPLLLIPETGAKPKGLNQAFKRYGQLLHRLPRIRNLALSGLDDRTIDLAGAHGDAGEADFVQAADCVDIATVFAADEDFELRDIEYFGAWASFTNVRTILTIACGAGWMEMNG